MKLEKAIERLQYSLDHDTLLVTQSDNNAVKLGIEALKRIQHLRGYSMTQVDTRLPGETE